MLAYYRALRWPAERAAAQRVRPPVHMIWGNRDRFLGQSVMEASLGRCERGSLTVVDEGTHWLHLEDPEPITTAIVRFCSD